MNHYFLSFLNILNFIQILKGKIQILSTILFPFIGPISLTFHHSLSSALSAIITLSLSLQPLPSFTRSPPRHLQHPHSITLILSIQVHILIRDLDDNKPAFLKKEVSTGVRVDAALQTEVLKLQAEDRDPTALPIRSVLAHSLLKWVRHEWPSSEA